MFKAVILAIIWWPFIFVVRVAMILLGVPLVTLAMLWLSVDYGSRQNFSQYAGVWYRERLPLWAWPWDNLRDGAMGDQRGWYWVEGYPSWIDALPDRLQPNVKRWYWLVIRNPANNFSRFTRGVGCNTAECTIRLLAGQDYVRDRLGGEGWQFVEADGPIFKYWGFYYVSRWQIFGRWLRIRLGHKIEPRHNGANWDDDQDKAWKGVTFRIGLTRV